MLLDMKGQVLVKYWMEECDEGIARIPEGVREIGDGAFSGCVTVEQVILPDGVTAIGSRAFEKCYQLQKIHFPDSLQMYGDILKVCLIIRSSWSDWSTICAQKGC